MKIFFIEKKTKKIPLISVLKSEVLGKTRKSAPKDCKNSLDSF